MTYRERRERRAERLRGWAGKRAAKSIAAFSGARAAVDGIPFGQPILVGHHSEARHRAALDRHDSRMRQGFEHHEKAVSMASKADEIDRQADRAIYSDDPDAIEQLEARITTLEAERARLKACNVAIRKHGLQRLVQPDPPFALTDDEKRELLKLMQLCPYHHADTKGFPSYALQNLGGNITRQRARLAGLKADAAQRARVRETLAAESETP